jgi:hypothetical protein
MAGLLTVLEDLEAFYKELRIERTLLKHIHSLGSVILGMKHPIAPAGSSNSDSCLRGFLVASGHKPGSNVCP